MTSEPLPVPPRHPLVGRQRHLVTALRGALAVALALGVAALVVPQPTAARLAEAFVALVVAVPLMRVTWLVVRWLRRRDLRFAAVGAALLCVVALAAASAW